MVSVSRDNFIIRNNQEFFHAILPLEVLHAKLILEQYKYVLSY